MPVRMCLIGTVLLLTAGCSVAGPGPMTGTTTATTSRPASASVDPSRATESTSAFPGTTGSGTASSSSSAATSAKASSSGSSTAATSVTAIPSGSASARRATVVSVLPTSAKVVALTFDGGADGRGAASILATLRREGVPASFFVTGRFVAAYPDLVAELAQVGPVGNHSWDHPHFPTLSDTDLISQLARTRSTILTATGQDPIPFFRFPFGDSDLRTRAAVAAHGYQAVGWTVDSLGWKGTSGGLSAAAVVDRVVAAARPGEIVLMHLGANPDDNTTLDADALPQVISRLRALGYRFVTLDTLR